MSRVTGLIHRGRKLTELPLHAQSRCPGIGLSRTAVALDWIRATIRSVVPAEIMAAIS
jgi:hypothetical protein